MSTTPEAFVRAGGERAEVRWAMLRLMAVCRPGEPDWKTSRADARVALSLAAGVCPDDIDSLGYDRTDKAYAESRASWVSHIAMHGWHDDYDRPHLDAARGDWTEHRPDLAGGDDWFADAWTAHLARYPDGCSRPGRCDICLPFTVLYADEAGDG